MPRFSHAAESWRVVVVRIVQGGADCATRKRPVANASLSSKFAIEIFDDVWYTELKNQTERSKDEGKGMETVWREGCAP